MAKQAVTQANEACAIVFDFASRYIVSPERLEQAEVDSYTMLLQASMEARDVKTEQGILKNLIIIIVNKLNDLPAWFYLQNPNVKAISLDTPSKEERETLVKGSLVLFCEMVWVLSETVTTALYTGRGGADVVSGMAASFAIANLYFVAFGGIYSATGVILGKTLGEGNLEKARQQKTWLLSGSAVFGVLMTAFGLATTLIIPVVYGRLSDK